MNTINIFILTVMVAMIPEIVTARHILVKMDGANANGKFYRLIRN